ncbi:hypothetical protein [Pseudomonas sp. S1(2024)]|uniref:hypothetical protein n=1 Tax=Pseudomonas sp. S1(2024) TaxID=3390191 RepID=UPI0039783D4C
MMLKKIFSLSALAAATLSAGCTVVDKSYDQGRQDMRDLKSSVTDARKMKASSVDETDGIWLGGDPFHVSQEENAPAVLKRVVSVKQLDPISASDIISMISNDLGVKIIMTQDAIDYTNGVVAAKKEDRSADAAASGLGVPPPSMNEESIFKAMNAGTEAGSKITFTLNYKGTAAGLLDLVATKAGLFWKHENGEIVLRRYETKTFILDVAPGGVEFESEIKSDLSTNGSSSESSSTSDSVHTVKSTIKTDSAFKAVQSGVQSMLSSGGSIAIAESTGNMTVTDTPQVLRRVENYIKTQNAIASKQVAIKTEIYEISSDENGEFDPQLSALYDWGDLKLGISDDTLTFSRGGHDSASDNKFSGDSKAAMKLLRTNKNVTQVTSSTIYAQNGEPTPFQQLDEIGYLAEVQIETAGASSDTASDSNLATLKPGKTSQGFSMTIIPRINSEGRVQMKLAMDSSRLNSIDAYGLDGGAQIQTPNRSTNKYNQLVTVRSGQPLMIAGLEQTSNKSTIESMFGRRTWMLGGSQAGGKKKVMTMIVLTPYILQK